jgi:hypothetical protein
MGGGLAEMNHGESRIADRDVLRWTLGAKPELDYVLAADCVVSVAQAHIRFKQNRPMNPVFIESSLPESVAIGIPP